MILVCGGAGYIGSHMVYELIDRGYEVVVADNLSTGHLQAVHPKAVFHHVDIRDKSALDSVFKAHAIEAVVHFAASSLVGESMTNPLKYFDNNVGGSRNLLEVMRDHEVNRIVFSSTAATYGIPESSSIKETDPTNPINPYGESKLMVERMLKTCETAHGIRSVCLRYFNVAGAHESGVIGEDHNPETHLIPLILQVPLGKRPHISVFGNDYNTPDGTCIRDYIHVSDLVDAHVKALEYLEAGSPSRVFNLGNGKGFSVLEMIEAARRVTGHAIESRVEARRPGDPDHLVACADLAGEVLGWRPQYTGVEDIIRTAWQFHQKHPKGFEGALDGSATSGGQDGK